MVGTISDIKDFMFVITDNSDTPYSFTFDEKPKGLENVSNGDTVTVTYTKASNADGYDVVLGTSAKNDNGELRPYHYGDYKILNINKNKVTVEFKNVSKETWTVGMRSFTKDPDTGKKVFSRWSNLMPANMK